MGFSNFYLAKNKILGQELCALLSRSSTLNSKQSSELRFNSNRSFDAQSVVAVGQPSRSKLTPLAIALGFACSDVAMALGVGGVEARSYIGQPLWVEVPIYNVDAPNSLQINLQTLNDGSSAGLSAELSRAKSQLSVLIRSKQAVHEPFFNFALTLNDNGHEFRKEFTVLLDLSPNGGRTEVAANASRSSLSKQSSQSVNAKASAVRSVMGPYDWAKAGAVAEKFGAVLDGQSLWRVARRISPAMNASNNQMMWALYQANPQAFSSASIESLRAGSYLSIPRAAQVLAVSDAQAKSLLSELSSAQPSRPKPVAKAESQDLLNKTGQQTVQQNPEQVNPSELEQFTLTGLDQVATSNRSALSPPDTQSKEIIDSLAATVSSMVEQLDRKDEQIEVLEAQIADLKRFIQLESAESTVVSNSDDGAVYRGVESDLGLVSSAEAAIIAAPLQASLQPAKAYNASQAENNKFTWLLLLLAALMAFTVMMRSKLTALWNSLNFSGVHDQVEFQPTQMSQAMSGIRTATDQLEIAEYPDLAHSVTVSQQAIDDDLELSFDNAQSYSESVSELFIDEDIPEDELDFEQRFARLIAEGDLEFAGQLLEIAHGHDVNHERYHFYRLQLFALRYDEDSFYSYYTSIEDDIPSFNNIVQTDISKLVVQLAQN